MSEDGHLSILKIEAQDRESESHGEVTAALIAESDGENHVAEISDQRFKSKQTIEKEFAFAILIFVVGLGFFYKTLNHA